MQEPLWIAAGALMALSAGSGVAEWRRSKRSNLDSVGWMPWTFIQVMSLLFAIVTTALAIKG
ncbi:MAG: hypothetical protein CVT77_17930 [Alphaproteobacteria bacterium HGW-Alphaproteobacteria-16]|nr:MAG: hypothetical protein CVT77_17930 [Alphaproteobacteria bacterium HGW-Alphaproteobacteria-16]